MSIETNDQARKEGKAQSQTAKNGQTFTHSLKGTKAMTINENATETNSQKKARVKNEKRLARNLKNRERNAAKREAKKTASVKTETAKEADKAIKEHTAKDKTESAGLSSAILAIVSAAIATVENYIYFAKCFGGEIANDQKAKIDALVSTHKDLHCDLHISMANGNGKIGRRLRKASILQFVAIHDRANPGFLNAIMESEFCNQKALTALTKTSLELCLFSTISPSDFASAWKQYDNVHASL